MPGDGSEPFQYAVLRVVPDLERGEALNAGVLVYCRQRDYLGSRVHLDADRLRVLDPTADADAIGRALRAAADVCAAEPAAGAAGREAGIRGARWRTKHPGGRRCLGPWWRHGRGRAGACRH